MKKTMENEVKRLSIRYTLRHNVPNELISAEINKYNAKNGDITDMYGDDPTEEDVNNFTKLRNSDYDFNLLRKHELAETDDNRVVYRQADGSIVDWTYEATERAEEIKNDCLLVKDDITEYANQTEERLNGIIEQAEEQQDQVTELIEEVEDMIDLEKITDEEIDTVVWGGNS